MGDLKVPKTSSWTPTVQSQAKLWFSTTWTPPDPDADHDSSPESSSDAPAVALVPDLIWRQPWVQRLCSACQQEGDELALQPQLTIGQVGDPYEVEADAIADKVMSMPAPQPAQIQRQGDAQDPDPSEEEPAIQAQSLYPSIYQRIQRQARGSSRVGSDLENRLSHSKQGGTPLPDHVQAFMGPRLGVDLSPIRVHTDSSAVQMNRDLGAQAFAHGNHVYYGAGKGPANDHLTAHELTHTVQQGAVVRATPEAPQIQKQDDQEEPGFWGTIGGGLLGEFNEDPTLGQIGVDLIVGVIPIADQIADIRDIIAHLYYMISDRQYQDPMRWLGLALTLIGVIPIVGSVVKSASKVILKGADEVIGKLDELLDLLRRISPELADIGSFKRYLDQNWNSWVTEAIQTWNTILDQVGSGLRLIPNIVGDIKRQFEQSLEQIQQLSPRMLEQAFDTLKQRIDEVLDDVLKRLGKTDVDSPYPARTGRTGREVASETGEAGVRRMKKSIDGEHEIKLTESGRISVCSWPCQFLEDRFAKELRENPDFQRRWTDINNQLDAAEAGGDTVKLDSLMNDVVKLESDLRQARRNYIGYDPARRQVIAHEAEAGMHLEDKLGKSLERFDDSDPRFADKAGDWIDTATRKTYDAIGPVPGAYFKLDSFTNSFRAHLRKRGLDFVFVDMSGLSPTQIQSIKSSFSNILSSHTPPPSVIFNP